MPGVKGLLVVILLNATTNFLSSLFPSGTLGKLGVLSEFFWLSLCYWAPGGDLLRCGFLGIPIIPTGVYATRGSHFLLKSRIIAFVFFPVFRLRLFAER